MLFSASWKNWIVKFGIPCQDLPEFCLHFFGDWLDKCRSHKLSIVFRKCRAGPFATFQQVFGQAMKTEQSHAHSGLFCVFEDSQSNVCLGGLSPCTEVCFLSPVPLYQTHLDRSHCQGQASLEFVGPSPSLLDLSQACAVEHVFLWCSHLVLEIVE
jgi:hypothetical protein